VCVIRGTKLIHPATTIQSTARPAITRTHGHRAVGRWSVTRVWSSISGIVAPEFRDGLPDGRDQAGGSDVVVTRQEEDCVDDVPNCHRRSRPARAIRLHGNPLPWTSDRRD